ncbi:MAG: aminotransferase class III-fold pyridoxal phosphate-dependent enzyme [Pirellulales bacterium]
MPHASSDHPIIEHRGETVSNALRRRLSVVEPRSLRTYTPSLAVIAKSAGCFHWTADGRKLADFTSGVLVANLGHNSRRWWERVWAYLGLDAAQQIGDADNVDGDAAGFVAAAPLTAYNAATELEILACERLLANLRAQPGGRRMEQVLWSASGSEAIQKALWACLARRPGSDIMLATRSGFHGKKGLAGAITGGETDSDRDGRVHFVSFPTAECQNVARRREPIDLAPYCGELEHLWSEFGERIACLCTEPYLGGGGSFHPQREYLQLLGDFCRRHDIVFILDEIQSNFGRTGPMYAFTRYGVEPDIVCLGKGLGNGIPVSAAVGRADVFAALKYGQASDTWSANPLASAAVLATLDEFESTDVLDRAATLAGVLERGLLRLVETGAAAQVRGEGVVWGIECAAIGDHTAEEVANACVEACYVGDEQGRAIHLLGPLAGKVLRISPPLVLAPSEAETYLDVMHGLFTKVARRFDG